MPDWTDLHRAIIGDFLGYLSMDSWERGAFLASALAVSKATTEPSEGFRTLLKQVDLLPVGGKIDLISFWSAQVKKAHNWFGSHDW